MSAVDPPELPPARSVRRFGRVLLVAVAALAVAWIGAERVGGGAEPAASDPAGRGATTDEVRLGYFPNLTHAPALVGLHEGTFADALGDVRLDPTVFNAGPDAVTALLSGAVDAAFIGPNPAINGFVQSRGAVRIVAGSTSGGAFLVVRDGIESPADLAGTTLASPQLANTQDIALRAWLREQGYDASAYGGGEVTIRPQNAGRALDAFRAGEIDGAWLPEPWASRFVLEAGAHVLVDERDRWPDGRYVTSQLVVRTEFLAEHPDVVRRLIAGEQAALELIAADPARARNAANDEIAAVTGTPLAEPVLRAAWDHLEFTVDPIAPSLVGLAEDAAAVGLLEDADLTGIHDLTLLDDVLAERGQRPVGSGAGAEIAAPAGSVPRGVGE